MQSPVRKVVILGGGTAGWIAASALVKVLGARTSIELVESDEIGTVGVGEATIPQIRLLNQILGLDENEFIARTNGSFKLGIEFVNWGAIGEAYLHTFGDIGIHLGGVPFHHYWLRAQKTGNTESLWDYSLHDQAARLNRFARLERVGTSSMQGLSYAFHFDAGLYAKLLREYSQARGVVRTEGKVSDVQLDAESGNIRSLILAGGREVSGDLFIDCSGFRGLLIGETLKSPYEDWSHWLPVNRAWAVPTARAVGPLRPYTRSTAHGAGWQWRIPLQHRTGNGHVFCDGFTSEADAQALLLANLDAAPLAEPKLLKFVTGLRREFWKKNCVSLGLASGFMEPLESTSIHLVQSHVSRLLQLFPLNGIARADVAEYNRQSQREFERIRDFIILHYKLTRRSDTPFWNYVRHMPVPDTLAERMELFEANGRIFREQEDLFKESSWLQVMTGQGAKAAGYHPMAELVSEAQFAEFMSGVKALARQTAEGLPDHADFIARTCAAKTESAL